jgi:hypothetical protein
MVGIIAEDKRFELADGEIVPINPKIIQHKVLTPAKLDYS